MKIPKLLKKFLSVRWELGLVRGGMPAVFSEQEMEVDWVKSPYRDRWFADPFILDVTDATIIVLAEEYRYAHPIARIAKLTIDRHTFCIVKMDILLDLPTHLSFPNILRTDEGIFVYPENCLGGSLKLYKFDNKLETLRYEKTICDDCVWDSSMTNFFGEWQLWTARQDDYHLDIYSMKNDKFEYDYSIESQSKNSRLAGQLFMYNEKIYYPAQDCSQGYGGGVIIKQIIQRGEKFELVPIKKLTSPHKTLKEGLHTLNEYKGQVVIDVLGYNYPRISSVILKCRLLYKKLLSKKI